MAAETIQICMITDEGYVTPTCVAIQSMKEQHHQPCAVHVLTEGLPEASVRLLEGMSCEDFSVQVHPQQPDPRMDMFRAWRMDKQVSASVSALMKFSLGNLFPDLDRIIYLDGDLLVRGGLEELWATPLDMENEYAAAVMDVAALYYQRDYIRKVAHYFNSGVMVLNLALMRAEHADEKLIAIKQELQDRALMDQNALNTLFDGQLRLLPPRYNFLHVNLDRAQDKWTQEQFNAFFGVDYSRKADAAADAQILHFASRQKPWKDPTVAMADLWLDVWRRSPAYDAAADAPAVRPADDALLVSVVMPCYNAAAYVRDTAASLLAAGIPEDRMEIIALDDGSTDDTLSVLRELAQAHPCLRVESSENHGAGYQRNRGIEMARGTYVYFMDSDDLLVPGALKRLTDVMAEKALDLVWFEADDFYESDALRASMPGYASYYHRREWYPRIMTGRDLFTALRLHSEWRVGPPLQLIRRDVLTKNGVTFPEMRCLEDNLYALRAACAAERAMVLPDRLYRRRVHEGSVMTSARAQQLLEAYAALIPETLAFLPAEQTEENAAYCRAIAMQADSFAREAAKCADGMPPEERAALPASLAGLLRYAELRAEQARAMKALKDDNRTLRTEKAERWQEMQALHAEIAGLKTEKAGRWQEMQALRAEIAGLKAEKAERWQEMQALRKERADLLRERAERWKENEAAKKKLHEQIKAMEASHKEQLDDMAGQCEALMEERHYLRGQLEEQFKLMDQARRSVLVRVGMRIQGVKTDETKKPNE